MKKFKILFFVIVILILGIGIKSIFFKSKTKNDDPVVFNLGINYNTLDPHLFTEMISVQVDSSIYEGLLRLDKKGNYTGGVAESFTENNNKMTFKIRKNAKWSDGSRVTANDFVFAFRRVLNPKTAARFSEMLFPIKNAEKYYEGKAKADELGVKAIDDNNLEIEFEHPVAYFKYILTLPITAPIKENFYKTHEKTFAVNLDSFLFNGPYKITKLSDGETLLEKNENYWNAKNIKIPKIKYIVSSDFHAVDNLIENGEIDISRVENYNLEKYRKDKTLNSFLIGKLWYLDYNLNNKFLKNQKLRQAISMAIDRDVNIKKIKNNDGSIAARSVISNQISGYSKKYREEYPDNNYINDKDPKLAKKLYDEALKELGVKELELGLLAGNSDPETLEIQHIQEELRVKLGLKTKITVVSLKERLNMTRSEKYDIVLNTWSPKYDDATTYFDRWKTKDNKNASVWQKQKYDLLVDEIYKMPKSAERDKKINEAEKILIDDAVIAPIYFAIENTYTNPKIHGLVRREITGITDFTYAYIK